MSNESTRQRIEKLLKEGKTPQEVRQQTNASKSYIYKIASDIEKDSKDKQTQTSTIEAEEVKHDITELKDIEAEGLPKLETAEGGGEPTLEKSLTSAVLRGYFSDSDLKMVFDAINEILPEKARKSEKATALLGKIWCKPTNRMIEKYMDQNIDLYLAVGLTVVMYAPSIWSAYKEYRKPKPQQEATQNGKSS